MKYGLIGEKLGHSFSVPIHNALGNPDYELREIPRGELKAFLEEGDFQGLNVTIPYKQDVIPFCETDEAAREIGAVNTIVCRNQKLYGYNTDAYGLSALIGRTLGAQGSSDKPVSGEERSFDDGNGENDELSADLRGMTAVILGAGGTAKTALYVLRRMGADRVIILARNTEKAAEEFRGKIEKDRVQISGMETIESRILEDANILVNTTPVGMYPRGGIAPVDVSKFTNLKAVIDVVYNPLTTKLVVDAKKLGIPAANGLFMLVMQALRAEQIFFDENPGMTESLTYEKGKEVYINLLRKQTNLVLVGMPGSGKSTLGKYLSERMKRELVDTDEVFEQKFATFPGTFIELHGEDEFRKCETEAVKIASEKCGVVIATGGGVVTRPENIELLKQNGKIVYIKRELAFLSSDGRPLSKGDGAIEKLFEKRKALYEEAADFVAEVKEEQISTTGEEILKFFGADN